MSESLCNRGNKSTVEPPDAMTLIYPPPPPTKLFLD